MVGNMYGNVVGSHEPSCRIRFDSQTNGLTLTTGVRWICTKRRCASNMNIHYDVTGLLSAVWKVTFRSTCLCCLSWPDNFIDEDDTSQLQVFLTCSASLFFSCPSFRYFSVVTKLSFISSSWNSPRNNKPQS